MLDSVQTCFSHHCLSPQVPCRLRLNLLPATKWSSSISVSCTLIPFRDVNVNQFAAPRHLDQTDWQILALQPADSTLQLQSTLHDPINSRLVDSEDAMLYFDL
jgi:hypothetical protein